MKIKNTDVRPTMDGAYHLTPRADFGKVKGRHLFDKTESLWRHQTRMPDGLDRDWQRNKVYTAERLVRVGRAMSWPDTLRFVAKVLNSAKFQRRWGRWGVEVRDGRGRVKAAAYGSRYITLPGWARTEDVVLHELAHILCPGWEQHGRLFARTYLELVKLFMGKDQHDRLRDSFREHGVRFTPRRKADFRRTTSRSRRQRRTTFDPFSDLLGL